MWDITLSPDRITQVINHHKLFEVLKISVGVDIYALVRSPVTARSVAESLGTDELFVICLLNVLCALGLVAQVNEEGDTAFYQSTSVARQYLDSESALYLGGTLFDEDETHRLLVRYVNEGPSTTPITTEYWTAELITRLEAVALLGGVQDAVKLIDLTGRTCLLDIGGGHGLYSIFFVKQYPALHAVVLDLPQVIGVTQKNIEKYGVSARVTTVAGDYRTFESDQLFDVVFMSNVTPSSDELRFLLKKACDLLAHDGAVIIRSYISDSARNIWSAVNTLERYARRGKPGRTCNELIDVLSESGFTVTTLYESDGVIVLHGARR